jgi:hypothetical protein
MEVIEGTEAMYLTKSRGIQYRDAIAMQIGQRPVPEK